MSDGYEVPNRLLQGLIGYRDRHRPTGGFLRKVIENDLTAVLHADPDSLSSIQGIVKFVINELPANARGSQEAYTKWVEKKEDTMNDIVNALQPGKAVFTDQKGRAVVIKIEQDICPENPLLECCGTGDIHSFNTKHANYLRLEASSVETLGKELTRLYGEKDKDWMYLSYYEHGRSIWFPQDEIVPGVEFQWDGRRFAGVWCVTKEVRENLDQRLKNDERTDYERLLAYCSNTCKQYTQYCNGDIWGYEVSIQLSSDAELKAVDSCYGIYGLEEAGIYAEILACLKAYDITQLLDT